MDNQFINNMSFLDNVNPENSFILNNGFIIKSVPELANVLDELDDAVFNHHVNSERNDFANWIRFGFNDNKLADKLQKATSREDLVKVLKTPN